MSNVGLGLTVLCRKQLITKWHLVAKPFFFQQKHVVSSSLICCLLTTLGLFQLNSQIRALTKHFYADKHVGYISILRLALVCLALPIELTIQITFQFAIILLLFSLRH